MAQVYRVVVSENPKRYPDKTFIDFAPANLGNDNYSTHEIMLRLRQKVYPEVELKTDGLLLYDFGDGNIRFKTEVSEERRLADYDPEILARYQDKIIEAFHKMRAAGKDKTIEVNNYNMAEIIDFYSNADYQTPVSAKEADLREKSKYYLDLEERRRDLLQRRHNRYERD